MPKTTEDLRDWCPVCGAFRKNTKELATHMKDDHNRLILEQDINEQDRRISARARAAEWLEEEAA